MSGKKRTLRKKQFKRMSKKNLRRKSMRGGAAPKLALVEEALGNPWGVEEASKRLKDAGDGAWLIREQSDDHTKLVLERKGGGKIRVDGTPWIVKSMTNTAMNLNLDAELAIIKSKPTKSARKTFKTAGPKDAAPDVAAGATTN